MPFDTPRLDDRTFDDIVREALRRIPLYTPEWTDHNLSDPGITLIELFAWMTDVILYRLNRVPDRHYVKLMELIGMKLREPEAARTRVTFWLSAPQPTNIEIQAGTEAATPRTENTEAIVFSTNDNFTIRVADLNNVMTSFRPADGQERQYINQNLRQIQAGFGGFSIFQDKPQAGDAVYFGFGTDLSHHILGLDLGVDRAAGAGIDPTRPPYTWEVLSETSPPTWTPCDVDSDGTKAFNVSGVVRLHLPEMTEGQLNRRRAYWLRCRLQQVGPNQAQYDESPKIIQATAATWGATIATTHASRVLNEVLGRSDGSPGQKFYLEQSPVLPRIGDERILVRISQTQEELWTEVADFADSSSEDRHYMIDSSTGEVHFGPALPQRDGSIRRYGAIPPQSATIIMQRYRYGGGAGGNVQKGALNVLKTSIPYIDRISNRQPAYGGLNMESLDEAKMRVPSYLRALRRAVTANDYEYLAKEAAPGKIARAYALPVEGGLVNLFIIPRVTDPRRYIEPSELAPDKTVQEAVRAYLDERRLLTTRMELLAPQYYWVQANVHLKVSDFADKKKVEQAALDRLYAFINPIIGGFDGKGWPFGRDLFSTDIIACLQGINGIEFIRNVQLLWVQQTPDGRQVQEPKQVIETVSHGIIASYRHEINTGDMT